VPLDKVAPGAVKGLVINAPPTGGRLELRWTESTDDTSAYVLLRDAGDGFEELARLPRGTTYYEDTPLENDMSYLYKIYALDLSLNEGPLSDAVIGLPMDVIPPAVPTIEPLPDLTNKLRLQVRGTGEPFALIEVQVNGQVVTGEEGLPVDADGNWSGTIDLVPKENRIRVRARDVSGNPSGLTPEALVYVDVTAPSITYQAPVAGQAAVPVDQVIELTFSETLVQSSVVARLEYEPGGEVASSPTYDGDSRTLRIFPTESLEKGTTFRVVVDGVDRAGNHLSGGTFTFTTVEEKAHAQGVSPVTVLAIVLLLVLVAVVAVLVLRRARTATGQREDDDARTSYAAYQGEPPYAGEVDGTVTAGPGEGPGEPVPQEGGPAGPPDEGPGEAPPRGGWEEF
jgi:methionine-rich copper-binding protein CopC